MTVISMFQCSLETEKFSTEAANTRLIYARGVWIWFVYVPYGDLA